MSFSMWLTLVVFLAAVLMIASKRFNKAAVAIGGGALCLAAGLLNSDMAVQQINWKAIFLLVGMMIIISVVKRTGVFQFIAIRAAKVAKGNPLSILVLSSLIAAAISMLFGPVLTLVAFAPVSILIAIEMGMSPLPFLIAQIVSANVGGMMTLVGDPVSVLIGTETGFGFLTFLANNGPVGLIVILVSLMILAFAFRNQLKTSNERRARIMDFDESRSIQDRKALIVSLVVIVLVLAGYVLAPLTKVEPFVVALCGAVLLLALAAGRKLDEILHEIEWGTILYVVGLFIMTLSLESQGVTRMAALFLANITRGDAATICLVILWTSALAAAFVDTIPFVIMMIPVIQGMSIVFGAAGTAPMWWALSLGSVIGGNATLIGAQANLSTAAISAKSGYPITFATFARYSTPVAIIGLLIASGYILFRYFVLRV